MLVLCEVYILFSPNRKCYYSGITKNPDVRLKQHRHEGNKSTRFAADWLKLFSIILNDYSSARTLEKAIKNRSARRFLDDYGSALPSHNS